MYGITKLKSSKEELIDWFNSSKYDLYRMYNSNLLNNDMMQLIINYRLELPLDKIQAYYNKNFKVVQFDENNFNNLDFIYITDELISKVDELINLL